MLFYRKIKFYFILILFISCMPCFSAEKSFSRLSDRYNAGSFEKNDFAKKLNEAMRSYTDEFSKIDNQIQELSSKSRIDSDKIAKLQRQKKDLQNQLKEELLTLDSHRNPPLYYAITLNEVDLARRMIEFGCDVNATDGTSCPLIICALKERPVSRTMIELLIKNGADADSIYISTPGIVQTALWWACLSRDTEIIRTFIEKAQKLDTICSMSKNEYIQNIRNVTALYLLVSINERHYYDSLIELLLQKKCNVNIIESNSGKTMLHLAAERNDYDLYIKLKKYGAKNSVKDISGRTPVDYLSSHSKTAVDAIKIYYEEEAKQGMNDLLVRLTSSGIDQVSSLDSKTAMQIALLQNDEATAIKLLELGSSYTKEDSTGHSAFDYAVLQGCGTFIEAVLKKDAKVSTVLFSAIEGILQGSADYLNMLLSYNVDKSISYLDSSTGSRWGAVAYSVIACPEVKNDKIRISIIERLIKTGFDINEVSTGGTDRGMTALMAATRNRSTDIVSFIIKNGGDCFVQQQGVYSGRIALCYSLENGTHSITELLLEAMDYNVSDIVMTNNVDKQCSMLHFVSRYANFEEAKAMLPSLVGAIERGDGEGLTPFMYAASYNSDWRVMKALRMYGANVFALSTDNHSALYFAEQNNKTQGREEIITRLKEYGL